MDHKLSHGGLMRVFRWISDIDSLCCCSVASFPFEIRNRLCSVWDCAWLSH